MIVDLMRFNRKTLEKKASTVIPLQSSIFCPLVNFRSATTRQLSCFGDVFCLCDKQLLYVQNAQSISFTSASSSSCLAIKEMFFKYSILCALQQKVPGCHIKGDNARLKGGNYLFSGVIQLLCVCLFLLDVITHYFNLPINLIL